MKRAACSLHHTPDVDEDSGFTLIELLVVVLIIGILAAVALPAFLAQRQSGWEAQLRSDLHNASIAAQGFAADHAGAAKVYRFDSATGKVVGPTSS